MDLLEPEGTPRERKAASRPPFPPLRNISSAGREGLSTPAAPAAGANCSRPPARPSRSLPDLDPPPHFPRTPAPEPEDAAGPPGGHDGWTSSDEEAPEEDPATVTETQLPAAPVPQTTADEEGTDPSESLLAELALLREENEALRIAAKRVGITDETVSAVKHRCKFMKMWDNERQENSPVGSENSPIDLESSPSSQGSLEDAVPNDALLHVLPWLVLADAGAAAIVFRGLSVPAFIASRPSIARGGEAGFPLLHDAIERSAPVSVAEALLAAYPEAAYELHGPYLPLHLACRNPYGSQDAAMVKALLRIYPDAMTVEAAGWLPLHLATENNAPIAVVQALLEAESTAHLPNFEGWLPLHFAVEQHSELALVSTLVDAHPDGVRGVTESPPGRTALHVAARERAPLEVIAALLEWNPEAAKAKDGDGCLPLHLLFDTAADAGAAAADAGDGSRDVSVEHVRLLLDANPEAAREPDNSGELPLHLAASGSLPAVAILLDAYPAAVTIRGSRGLPLTLASTEPVRAAIRRTAKDVRAAAAAAKAEEEAKAKAEAKKKPPPKKTGGQSNRKTVKKAITKVASQPKKARAKKK